MAKKPIFSENGQKRPFWPVKAHFGPFWPFSGLFGPPGPAPRRGFTSTPREGLPGRPGPPGEVSGPVRRGLGTPVPGSPDLGSRIPGPQGFPRPRGGAPGAPGAPGPRGRPREGGFTSTPRAGAPRFPGAVPGTWVPEGSRRGPGGPSRRAQIQPPPGGARETPSPEPRAVSPPRGEGGRRPGAPSPQRGKGGGRTAERAPRSKSFRGRSSPNSVGSQPHNQYVTILLYR